MGDKSMRTITVNTSSPSFVNLFAGCGGLTLGLMRAGWKGIFAVEKDKFAFQTLQHNLINSNKEFGFDWPAWFPEVPCEIGSFVRRYRQHIIGLKGRVDLVAGGPPCQGFSFAGLRKKNDPRNLLFHHYVEVVRLIEPKFILLENVGGITFDFSEKDRRTSGKRRGRPPKPFSERIKDALGRSGYLIFPDLVRAVDFGVPQLRPRYIQIGIRKDLFPLVENNPFVLLSSLREDFLTAKKLATNRPTTVKEAISDLETTGAAFVDCQDSQGFLQVKYRGPLTPYQRLLHGAMNGESPNSMRLVKHRDKTRERFENIMATCRKGVGLSKSDR
jgi:DNA (cytosine-5)-methyltransferase 1